MTNKAQSQQATMTCAELLIRLLRDTYGVRALFGIPGVHTVELYRGLEGSDVQHITPRHEQGAGFMADGYARASDSATRCWTPIHYPRCWPRPLPCSTARDRDRCTSKSPSTCSMHR